MILLRLKITLILMANESDAMVDILIPDFTYIREIKDQIVGIITLMDKEDHIMLSAIFILRDAICLWNITTLK